MSRATLLMALGLGLAGAAGFVGSVAFGSAPPPTRTVTVNLRNGATGPAGPRGATGAAGSVECPQGFSPGELVINHPGGQVSVYACLKD